MDADARTQRRREFAGFLTQKVRAGLASGVAAGAAWAAWTVLEAYSEMRAPVPNASVGPCGTVLLTWDDAEHHLECEAECGEGVSFFYRSRRTEECWERYFPMTQLAMLSWPSASDA